MSRLLAALALASVTMLAGACGDNAGSGDSNPPNQQTQAPGPEPEPDEE
jgi:hypothetical protein